MSSTKNYLGQLEELVLLATLRLDGDGYGASIQELIAEEAGRDISLGALYATLDRLERKGFVSTRQGEPTPERGGRAKRYFKVEAAGKTALLETETSRRSLTAGLKIRLA
jgi:DNA-binding PadR family transcriptional regulator